MANTTLITSYPNKSGIFSMGPLNARLVTLTAPAAETYATGGYPYLAGSAIVKAMGMSAILAMLPNGCNTAALGIIPQWNFQTSKLEFVVSGGFTPAGTNGTSTVTGNFVVKGGGIGEATGINPDTNAGVLSKAAATDRTIPIATYAGATWTAGGQTFTGTAVAAAAMAQLANAFAIAAMAWNFLIIGQ